MQQRRQIGRVICMEQMRHLHHRGGYGGPRVHQEYYALGPELPEPSISARAIGPDEIWMTDDG
jgi:hypothetical protein